MQSASGGNHGSAVMGETPMTALPPQDRAASLLSQTILIMIKFMRLQFVRSITT
ncbi:MAG: hypothetical protein F6J98_07560 [Moorea sp. SIO4G2]|nr:hypothetical protein [Moorena sp. SIO4G2]